ncbi:N-acetyl-gamma-glutamyl-phosphate reductase [Bartonella sp. TP]|uniref:N-acetyl-gamma-glutamyl-phosphate reductase n=1 Tax=Bartonella sp. TP TaxID=3057550 RepID=UPI0025B07274|nr:N-acetyl-gamma-glutamyl-phosphate reductase [Bartonella sp. TP]WJW80044.1 N-acetyl-gamma-glutamyl-phosphate reductase [Bartonella sp. TP]
MHKIFIDGEHGTTGLEIHERLSKSNIELLSLPDKDYYNIEARTELASQADIVILCLPDNAAKAIAPILMEKANSRIIDSSTAYRTDSNWVYGFAELTKTQKQAIENARFVSNPGCYPTGALSLLRPLRDHGALSKEALVSIHAVSGYSGGGKALITQMTDIHAKDYIDLNYFAYGLHLDHKHNKEIKTYSLLDNMPIFAPSVGRFVRGMLVNTTLHLANLTKNYSMANLRDIFTQHYSNQEYVTIAGEEEVEQIQRLDPTELVGTDKLKIYIFGNAEQGTLSLWATLDNLGKGASGAAVQNLQLMLGY